MNVDIAPDHVITYQKMKDHIAVVTMTPKQFQEMATVKYFPEEVRLEIGRLMVKAGLDAVRQAERLQAMATTQEKLPGVGGEPGADPDRASSARPSSDGPTRQRRA